MKRETARDVILSRKWFQRTITVGEVRVLCDRQKRECTWCGETIPKRRFRWCSNSYREAFEWEFVPSLAAIMVWERDQGICQICGLNCELLKEIVKGLYKMPGLFVCRWLKAEGFGRGISEVDHIVPVIEGGGLCGYDGLRLVCGRCHARETALLAGKLAKSRRERCA